MLSEHALPVQPVEPGRLCEPNDHDLMLRFESLGHDCEFGLLQRAFGAEPLGMMRWGGTHIVFLIEALAADFAGLGAIENCEIVVGGNEYYLRENKYRLTRHTFVPVSDQENLDLLLQRHVKLLKFLLRHLREALADGEKIFVFKDLDHAPVEVVLQLSAALRRYGPARLLVIHEHRRIGQPAELQRVSEHAWIGRLDRFGNGDTGWQLSTAHWLGLLREVLAQAS